MTAVAEVGTDDQATLATPMVDVFAPPESQAQAAMIPAAPARRFRWSGFRALSVAGVLRLAFWPFKALWWPLRLLTLHWQRRAYQQRYRDQAVEPAGESSAASPAAVEPPSDKPAAAASPRLDIARLSLQFTVACILLLLPIQIAVYYQDVSDAHDRLMARANDALAALRRGRDELRTLRLASAADHFRQAQVAFQQARAEYQALNFFTRVILQAAPQGKRTVTAGLSLLAAGESIAELGSRFSSEIAGAVPLSAGSDLPALLDVLADFQTNVMGVLPRVAYARTLLEDLNLGKVSIANRERFLQAAQSLPEIEDALLDTAVLTRSVLHLLGADQWRRYLVVFQNNAELRATGGFAGSYALMDVEDGRIINLEIPGGGTYDVQGGLLALVSAPEPLHLVNPRWQFHDANWWPDFPTSARKLAWFLEQSRGGSVDGVIALTNSVVERMLVVTGPIALPEYGRVIEAGNFTLETQKIVELEYDRTANRPKQFIADLAPKLLERVQGLPAGAQQELLTSLYQALREKQLLIWSGDGQAQGIIEELGWAGQLKPAGLSDYLMVVNTNIAGGKTDRDVATSLRHAVTVQPDGRMFAAVTITRTHQGNRGDPFTGAQNNSYVRIYVPGGSKLISAYGFAIPEGAVFENHPGELAYDADLRQIEGPHQRDPVSGVEFYQELGKTVFAHWLAVKPGEQRSATITYELPFRFDEANLTYTLLAQKQPGTLGDELLSTLRLPSPREVVKAYPPLGGGNLQQSGEVVQFRDRLVTDKFYGIAVAQN